MKKEQRYVDGFVIPLKKKDLPRYKKMAEDGAKMWMKHGALEYYECVGDDLNIKGHEKTLGFPKLSKLKSDETVVFSWIVYKSKKDRDRINKKIMSDPAMQDFDMSDMPMDMKRFSSGGFKPIVIR